MSEFDLRGGQHFSNKCEIQKSLNYLLGGGAVKPNSDIVLKCFLFFNYGTSPKLGSSKSELHPLGTVPATCCLILLFIFFLAIGTSVRRSSRSAFGGPTGNDVSGH